MNIVRVTKEFSLDMAHALYAYPGPCRHIHGHTYHLSVTLRGKVKQIKGDPEDGMVMDFGRLKKIVQEEIMQHYDHALILKNESATLIQEEAARDMKWMLTIEQPTCENLLLRFRRLLMDALKKEKEVELVHLRLRETPTSYSEWFIEDHRR